MSESSEPPSDPSQRFAEEERITQNLRFRSLPATQRTLLGLFALVPYRWRGPLALVIAAIIGALAARAVPALVDYVKAHSEVKP